MKVLSVLLFLFLLSCEKMPDSVSVDLSAGSLASPSFVYTVEHLVDTDPGSVWMSASGVDETSFIRMTFSQPIRITAFTVANGHQLSSAHFKFYSRVHDLTLSINTNEREYFKLEDKAGVQRLVLSTAQKKVTELIFKVDSVYRGERNDKICLSDIRIYNEDKAYNLNYNITERKASDKYRAFLDTEWGDLILGHPVYFNQTDWDHFKNNNLALDFQEDGRFRILMRDTTWTKLKEEYQGEEEEPVNTYFIKTLQQYYSGDYILELMSSNRMEMHLIGLRTDVASAGESRVFMNGFSDYASSGPPRITIAPPDTNSDSVDSYAVLNHKFMIEKHSSDSNTVFYRIITLGLRGDYILNEREE